LSGGGLGGVDLKVGADAGGQLGVRESPRSGVAWHVDLRDDSDTALVTVSDDGIDIGSVVHLDDTSLLVGSLLS